MRILAIDFETFWDSKAGYTLSKMGPIEYIRDPRFAVQLMAVCDAAAPEEVVVYNNEIDMRNFLATLQPDDMLVGHNLAGFDALILSEHFDIHPKRMLDTIVMANWTGVSRVLRRSHEALTEFFRHGVKQAGTVVSDGKHWPYDFTPDEQRFFVNYCADDARQCMMNFASMLRFMSSDAMAFASITARMATEPKFVLDADILQEYVEDYDRRVAQARHDLLALFHFPDEDSFLKAVRSAPKFAVMLTSLGVAPPMKASDAKTKTMQAKLELDMHLAQQQGDAAAYERARIAMETQLPVKTYAFSKQDIDFLTLREHPDIRVAQLVETRLEYNSSVNRSRAERLLVFAKHAKPLPVMLSAFNAHTSRYTAGAADTDAQASDKLQFQNLSKRDPEKAKLRHAIKVPAGYKVVACDSSQVEARCLAWVAGETKLVGHFASGQDPYSELAADIFHLPAKEIHDGAKAGDKLLKKYRNVGKTAILSAGYGTSAQKFADTLLRQGAMLDPSMDRHYEMAFHAHSVYRASNPAIVTFWRTCQQVLQYLLMGETVTFGGPDGLLFTAGPQAICMTGDAIPSITMPSGYVLRYPNLRAELDNNKQQLYYDRPKGKNTIKTRIYGASLTENLIQGFAFQILMWQACRMNEMGIDIACNVHDSFATVVPAEKAEETQRIMERCMSMCPPWAAGLPIACESEVGEDFSVC